MLALPDQNSDSSDYQSDSDAISDVDRHPFHLEPTSLTDLETASASEPFPPTSEFESGSAHPSDFETLPSDDENPGVVLESVNKSEAGPALKKQKRIHLTHDWLLTQIGLQQQADNEGNSSRPTRTQAAPKHYARKKRSYTKRN